MNLKFAWMVVALQGLAACGDDIADDDGAAGGDSTSSGASASTTTTAGTTTAGTATSTATGETGGGDAGGGDTGGAGGTGEGGGTGGSEPVLPEACPDAPALQSPASFDEDGGIEPDIAETCETEGSAWLPCHEHIHCDAEHSDAGICSEAECEVHTVHRKRKDGEETEEVEKLHKGTVGGNCQPADHDLMVRARFVSFSEDCEAGDASNLTYCGSATGNNVLDVDADGIVTCEEAGVNPTSVRWCIETACVCLPGETPKGLGLGEVEATKEQGCPGD